jgi:hypothetical protein
VFARREAGMLGKNKSEEYECSKAPYEPELNHQKYKLRKHFFDSNVPPK